ncbi:hypothetical protein GUITHDRAFT_56177, partial [Guillardia theta CCMP2712]
SRISVVPAASGSEMLQERYCHDTWRLLVACILMSRVSSAQVKDKCINGFFDLFPTPSAFKVSDDEQVFEMIKPLGLFDSRIKGLRDVTNRFLSMSEFVIGLEKDYKPAGVGQF